MRSKKVTLSIPYPLWEALEKHALDMGYNDVRELLVFSPVYSLLVCRPHAVTAPLAQCPPDLQDEILDEVIGAWKQGEVRKGSYLEALLEEVTKRAGVALPVEVIRAIMADAVRKTGKKKQGSAPAEKLPAYYHRLNTDADTLKFNAFYRACAKAGKASIYIRKGRASWNVELDKATDAEDMTPAQLQEIESLFKRVAHKSSNYGTGPIHANIDKLTEAEARRVAEELARIVNS